MGGVWLVQPFIHCVCESQIFQKDILSFPPLIGYDILPAAPFARQEICQNSSEEAAMNLSRVWGVW